MSIDLRHEKLITFARAAKRIPRRRAGRPVSSSTIWRWHRRGVKLGDTRIYLEAVRLPSGMATSREALARFVANLTAGVEHGPVSHPTHDKDLADAVSALDRDKI